MLSGRSDGCHAYGRTGESSTGIYPERYQDGARTDMALPQAGAVSPAESRRRKRAALLNAVRYFVVQQRSGFLYLDMSVQEFVDYADDDLLKSVSEHLLPPRQLVFMLSGAVTGIDAGGQLQQVVARVRAAGISVGGRALGNGNLQLALIALIHPQCLALYAEDSALLPPRTVAGMLTSLSRITGEPACPVIADRFGSSGRCA